MQPTFRIGIVFVCSVLLCFRAAGEESVEVKQQDELSRVVTAGFSSGDNPLIQIIKNPWNFATYSSNGSVSIAGAAGALGDSQRDANTDPGGTLCPNAENPKAASTGPVILATGEKFLPQLDFTIVGLGGFTLKRTWRQYPIPSTFTPAFGSNWASSLDYGSLSYPRALKLGKYRAPPSITRIEADGTRTVYGIIEEIGTTDEDPWPTAGRYSANGAKYGEIYYDAASDVSTLTLPGSKLVFSNAGRIKSYAANDGSVDYLFVYGTFGVYTRVSSLIIRGLRTVNFTYNSNGLVQTVTAPNGGVWTYTYDSSNRLIRVTSPESTYVDYIFVGGASYMSGYSVNGVRKTNYAYDANTGQVTSSGKYDGEKVDTFVYTPTTTAITTENGLTTTYTYATVNGARRVTGVSSNGDSSCAAGVSSLEYDANGYVKAEVNKANIRNEYQYDASGYLLRTDEAKNTTDTRSITNVWDSSGRLSSATYRDGASVAVLVKTFAYVGATDTIQSITETDPRNGATRTTSYGITKNSGGRMVRLDVTRTGIGTESWVYDDTGNLTSTINASGQTTAYAGYNGLGLPTSITSIDGISTAYTYDLRGLTTSATVNTPSGSRATSLVWSPEGLLKQQTEPSGLVTQFTYTASSDRLTQVSDSVGNVTTYSRSGRVYTTSAPLKAPDLTGAVPGELAAGTLTATQEVNIQGNLWKATVASVQKVQNTYDAMNRLASSQDGAGNVAQFTYDALGRIKTQSQPASGTVSYVYDALSQLTQVTANGRTTTYGVDGLGRPSSINSPSTGTTSITADVWGRVTGETRPNGVSLFYTYDGLSRMRTRTSGIVTETWTYDSCTNGLGKLCSISNTSGSTNFSYDSSGNVTQQLQSVGGSNYTVGWGYDSLGRVTSMSYPGGLTLTYQYDGVGRLARILSNQWGTVIDNLLYQTVIPGPYAWRWGNGDLRGVTMDSAGRVQKIESPGVQSLTFGYTNNDLIQSLSNGINSALNSTFVWDGSGRLTRVNRVDGDNQDITYDTAGNRTGYIRAGVGNTYQYSASGRDWLTQVGSQAYNWDGYGQMISDGIRSLGWDGFGRLSTVAGMTYSYNTFNQRVRKAGPSGTNDFVYSPSGALLYESQSGTAYVYMGGNLIAMSRAGQMYAVHTDQVGRPEVVTNVSRQAVWRMKNAAWDRQLDFDNFGGLNIGFPGQYYDVETDLWQNVNRYYDAKTGRYIQSDPVGLAGGINSYAYVGGNPLTGVDANGLSRLTVQYSDGKTQIIDNPSGAALIDTVNSAADGSIVLFQLLGHGDQWRQCISAGKECSDTLTPNLNVESDGKQIGSIKDVLGKKMNSKGAVKLEGCSNASGDNNITKSISELLQRTPVTGGLGPQIGAENSPLFGNTSSSWGFKRTYLNGVKQ